MCLVSAGIYPGKIKKRDSPFCPNLAMIQTKSLLLKMLKTLHKTFHRKLWRINSHSSHLHCLGKCKFNKIFKCSFINRFIFASFILSHSYDCCKQKFPYIYVFCLEPYEWYSCIWAVGTLNSSYIYDYGWLGAVLICLRDSRHLDLPCIIQHKSNWCFDVSTFCINVCLYVWVVKFHFSLTRIKCRLKTGSEH